MDGGGQPWCRGQTERMVSGVVKVFFYYFFSGFKDKVGNVGG